MVGIERINLLRNNLNGTLPAQWSTLTSLNYINIIGNFLVGSLPSAWSNMISLAYLQSGRNDNPRNPGGRNQLTGTLPTSWSALQKLDYLGLHGLRMTGK